MFNQFIKLVVGDLDEKREYKQMMKRVNALPKEYKSAFEKIQKYMYTVGAPNSDIKLFTDGNMFTDLIELFEVSVAENRKVIDVIGSDARKFCDEFMLAYSLDTETRGERLNREIMERFSEGR